jgi:pyruvate,water dikinase
MRLHLYSRASLLPAVQTPLTRMAAAVGGPALVNRLLGGLGNTVETEIADDLWQLSRERLTVEEFVRRHGYHGPREGNPVAVVWREDRAPIESLARVYAKRPDRDAPKDRERGAQRAHREAAAELLATLPRTRRPAARLLLRGLRAQTRFLGLGKAAFLMAIDGARAATRRIGAELVEQGVAAEPDDAFYLTVEELLGEVPENFAEVVAFRRQRRAGYQRMRLPVTWSGMPVPETDAGPAAAGEVPAGEVPAGDVLTGTPGSGGIAEGPVRVVADPLDGDDLEPGEILVCRLTDPSWAALFPLADAVVIDIGGPASHGAVVSRELGIPCVIGTGDGTRVLRTGDRVRVNGDLGQVEILERA